MNSILKAFFLGAIASSILESRNQCSLPNCRLEQDAKISAVAQERFERWVHPGYYLSSDGTSAFVTRDGVGLEEIALGDDVLRAYAPTCERAVHAQFPKEELNEMKTADTKGQSCIARGFEISVMQNPEIKKNYKAAFEYLRLQGDFCTLSEREMIDEIKAVHKRLFTGVRDVESAGEFRNQDLFILDDKHSLQEVLDAKLPALPLQEAKEILRILNEGRSGSVMGKERRLLQKVLVLPPNWQEIPELMEAFCAEIKNKKEEGMNPIELAAVAHQKIVDIHPFGDGNGRVARIVMNAILVANGYNPVVFKSDEEYTSEVSKGATPKGVKSFAAYITKLIQTPL